MNDRVSAALALLAPHLITLQDPLYVRSILEDLHDGAQDDLIAELRTSHDAAAAWNVEPRRARARIKELHEQHGVGWLIGGMWFLRRSDIDRYPPNVERRRAWEQSRKEKQVKRFEITQIDHESFPPNCQPHLAEGELPAVVYISEGDTYREDAAQQGLLAHSPYCPNCKEEQQD